MGTPFNFETEVRALLAGCNGADIDAALRRAYDAGLETAAAQCDAHASRLHKRAESIAASVEAGSFYTLAAKREQCEARDRREAQAVALQGSAHVIRALKVGDAT